MILDKLTEFADGVSLNTGAAGTYLIGSQIDLSEARDVGNGEPVYLVITVDTAPTSADGTATAKFTLASDDSAAIATNGGATVHFETKAFTIAQMVKGAVLAVVALPWEGAVYERFLGILQTTGTQAFTAGKVNAFLTKDPASWKAYPDGL